jgi:hypothetical protein
MRSARLNCFPPSTRSLIDLERKERSMNAQTSRNRWLWLAPLALAFALLGILLVLLPAQAQGSVRYVATTGADSGNCSDSGAPCLTIGYAIGQASAGDTIQIGRGHVHREPDGGQGAHLCR